MSYTVNGKKYKYNSDINQKIKRQLVDRDVLACVTDMVADLINNEVDGWSYEDFENSTAEVSPCCYADSREATEDDLEAICTAADIDYNDPDSQDEIDFDDWRICESCGEAFHKDDAEYNDAEAYEFWIVDSSLGEDMRNRGEMILERYLGYIWGRQGTGQAIYLDGIIDEIAHDRGILEGQKYSWEHCVG